MSRPTQERRVFKWSLPIHICTSKIDCSLSGGEFIETDDTSSSSSRRFRTELIRRLDPTAHNLDNEWFRKR